MPWNPPPVPVLGDPATFRERIGPYLTWFAELNAADFFPVQSSPTDATPNRVMKVGAFGLGGSAATVSGTDLNNITVSGVYQTDASTLNKPPNISNGIVLHMARTSSLHTQLAISRSVSNPGEMAVRAKDSDGNWSAWRTVYSQSTILGTVSQSAGVPTGALIESGSNANGRYVRFADGTQICWQDDGDDLAADSASGGVYRTSAASTWTFPAAFSNALIFGAASPDTDSRWAMARIASNTAMNYRQFQGSSSATAINTRLFAIGRWF